ncbi:hypothetical protein PAXRUDRAFT_27670 [Paxillus rubicundulus Ve08.2h10]|uniref:Uncharacterized protein n=1 Tax=Paxillus rubicundulus Ve08.2h10 TaxID=930991 RepID=A0A0D0DR93_9AGAM|nr:hypothetical protein PAXRUDRAFT_27670 [Paxillus rubicundulus Ve08.2h10]
MATMKLHAPNHGVHWSELAHLPYFDLVQYMTMDPMHNLLLALQASTSTRTWELDLIHQFLSMIPVIWDAFVEEAEDEHQTSLKSFTKRNNQYIKDWNTWKAHGEAPSSVAGGKMKKCQTAANDNKEPKAPIPPKIFCSSSVKVDTLPRAEELFQEYLFKYKWMYGMENMKPNFHWAVHLGQQIKDYGLVYNFWAFLSEWLNKIRGALPSAESPVVATLLELMLSNHQEASGTIQDATTSDVARGVINTTNPLIWIITSLDSPSLNQNSQGHPMLPTQQVNLCTVPFLVNTKVVGGVKRNMGRLAVTFEDSDGVEALFLLSSEGKMPEFI